MEEDKKVIEEENEGDAWIWVNQRKSSLPFDFDTCELLYDRTWKHTTLLPLAKVTLG